MVCLVWFSFSPLSFPLHGALFLGFFFPPRYISPLLIIVSFSSHCPNFNLLVVVSVLLIDSSLLNGFFFLSLFFVCRPSSPLNYVKQGAWKRYSCSPKYGFFFRAERSREQGAGSRERSRAEPLIKRRE